MSVDPIESVLTALSHRQPVDLPVAMVVAHPDDETLGAGPFLHLFRRLLLVHVTDGAPRNRLDAQRAGFKTCEAYAAARRQELHKALDIAWGPVLRSWVQGTGAAPSFQPAPTTGVRIVALNIPDQSASLCLRWLAMTLQALLADAAVVLTHSYEGGHPDHDAVAFAVQAAGRPRIELALYHAARHGGIKTGRFLPGPPTTVIRLTPREQAVRTAMLDSFSTQQATLSPFRGITEQQFRAAPFYDFTQASGERAYYDGFDWGMTSERWRSLAAEALT